MSMASREAGDGALLGTARVPQVSVIMPAYNTAEYIAESLDSVFAQTFPNFEVIVINDGSPDTEDLEKALQPYRDRITYLKRPNSGLSATRNAGIREARGEFLAFLDSDDIWEPEYLAEEMAILQSNPALDMAYCDTLLFGETPADGICYASLYPPKTSSASFEALACWDCAMIFTCSVVVRRMTVLDVGLFDEAMPYCEDIDLWLRMAHHGARIAYHPKCLTRRRSRASAMSKDRDKMEQGMIAVLSKMSMAPGLSSSRKSLLEGQVARWHAISALRRGRDLLAEGKSQDAIVLLRNANEFFHRRKLGLAIAGLEIAPGLTKWVIRAWKAFDGLLERTRQTLTYGPLRSRSRDRGRSRSLAGTGSPGSTRWVETNSNLR